MAMENLVSLPYKELQACMERLGYPSFRAGQIFAWLHQKQVATYEEMTNVPILLRQALAGQYSIQRLGLAKKQVSKDGTTKYLFSLSDENKVEAVLMQYNHGNTLCISTQAGCRMGCTFCASTRGGLVRSLSAGEMAGEVYAAMADCGQRISNIVLMGIGEPLENLDEVLYFLSIITHPKGLGLSMRNVTLSTCGLVPGIDRLAEEKLALTLSVSLHAPTNKARSRLMPVNKAWPLEELMPACRRYRKITGRRVSFEYALAKGHNDSKEDADNLAKLLQGLDAHVNLIPLNPVDGAPYAPSERENVLKFQSRLQNLGVNATVRRRLGTDIEAACGQLRHREERRLGNEG